MVPGTATIEACRNHVFRDSALGDVATWLVSCSKTEEATKSNRLALEARQS